ncbi:olfactory receptor 12 [Camelus ferus]|nr:olfactory receptor 12 [Camelus ferus]
MTLFHVTLQGRLRVGCTRQTPGVHATSSEPGNQLTQRERVSSMPLVIIGTDGVRSPAPLEHRVSGRPCHRPPEAWRQPLQRDALCALTSQRLAGNAAAAGQPELIWEEDWAAAGLRVSGQRGADTSLCSKGGRPCDLDLLPLPASQLPSAPVTQPRAMPPHGAGNLSAMPWQEFVLEGFQGGLQTQALLSALFLALCVAAVLGNLTMIVVITLDARLHSPMYFFLKNLSLLDLCYTSVIYPKALATFLSSSRVITLAGCTSQFFFFSLLITTEGFLLAVMAYDRFTAICSPLHYPVTMCPSACARLVLGSYCGGCLNSIVQTSLTFSLPFCGSNHIDHFFLTILRMRSGAGRHKLFSTCGSHMTAVSLFYGTVFVMYAQPGAVESLQQGKVVSVFYTLVIPMLNPLIYSLRNKDVQEALRTLGQKLRAT